MMQNRILWIVTAMAVGTMITRFLPFLLFPQGKKMPRYVEYLGQVLPYATMGLLVVYCLKGIHPFSWPFGLPEFTASAAVAAIHVWKKNSLLSIGAGTLLYMVLVQAVFL